MAASAAAAICMRRWLRVAGKRSDTIFVGSSFGSSDVAARSLLMSSASAEIAAWSAAA